MSRFDEEPDADPHGECAAEIHRLQAQVEALTAQLDSYAMALNETKAERDSYKKDAERYRWLRAGNYSIALSCSILNDTPHGIDKTIDAAIAKETA